MFRGINFHIMRGDSGKIRMMAVFAFFISALFILTVTAGCTMIQNSPKHSISSNTISAAIDIALNNSTVRAYLSNGYTLVQVGPKIIGINMDSYEVTAVRLETPQDYIGVNVDIAKRTIQYLDPAETRTSSRQCRHCTLWEPD